jgi:cytochrome oxidase complex assembly protein 1
MFAVGVVFIFLGRWLYLNPRRLVPVWGIFNREHPGVQKVARAYATFLIFFGAIAVAGPIVVWLLPGVPGTPILGLVLAVVLAWLLRRGLSSPAIDSIGSPVGNPAVIVAKQNLLSGHWKRNLLIVAGFAILLVGIITSILGNSDVSKLAFASAQGSPAVKERLGEPIKRGFFTSGNIEISGPMGKADIAFPISGPRGKATVYAVAQKSAGLWKFETLQVSFGSDGVRADLLQQGAGSGQH